MILKRNWRSIFIAFVFIVDSLAIMAGGLAAYHVRGYLPNIPILPVEIFFRFTLFFGSILLFMGCILGLYRSAFHSDTARQYFIAAKAYAFGVLFSFSAIYLLHTLDFPRRFTILFFLVTPVFFIIGRSLMQRFNLFMQYRGYGIHKVLLVGYENGGIKIFERFRGFPELGYDVKGVVTKTQSGSRHKPLIAGAYVPHFKLSEVEMVAKRESIDRIFVPHAASITNGYASVLDLSRRNQIKVKVLSPEADQLLRRAHVHDIAGITLFAPRRYKIEFLRRILKRGIDLIVSSLLLLIISPVLLVTSLAIIIESGFPVIFRQRRASLKHSGSFFFYKFRSMIQNADEVKESLWQYNESEGPLFKMKNDPRLTKVGRFIRKFSIDELPQLINVFLGDMSLVGPRPLPPSDFEKITESEEFWDSIKDRAKVKPGMTGLWQISGRSNIGFREMILLDLYYVENQSFLFDLEILFATVPVVLFGKGAY